MVEAEQKAAGGGGGDADDVCGGGGDADDDVCGGGGDADDDVCGGGGDATVGQDDIVGCVDKGTGVSLPTTRSRGKLARL